MIIFRIDVDYPYPSRIKSFIYTAIGLKLSREYLLNSKIIAKMINKTPKPVKAYWFFTTKTAPDRTLRDLLSSDRHEISLHVVNDPYAELKFMENATGKKIRYYTIHGTARFLARLMWKRKATEALIPEDFPLTDFTKYPVAGFALDTMCYHQPTDHVVKAIAAKDKVDYVLYFHPIWLFQRGRINHRGPFYDALAKILETDKESENLVVRRKFFFKIARDAREYEIDVIPKEEFIDWLTEMGVDIFTFLERKWCFTLSSPSKSWARIDDNVAILPLTNYNEWWTKIGKKTRNMIRKAEKSGVKTATAQPDKNLAEGIWNIYNETPIRQERAFPHYGTSLESVTASLASTKNAVYIGAYLQDELIGFVQLILSNDTAIISQILSLQKHWDKAVNNALIAKTIEVSANRQMKWIMYGRMGNHPTLDMFKENNGFTKFTMTRYYVPLTGKGEVAIRLGMHRELKDTLPQAIKYPLFPFYNWISRTKMKLKLS